MLVYSTFYKKLTLIKNIKHYSAAFHYSGLFSIFY